MMDFHLSEREMLIVTRRQKGIKQQDIANELDITQGAISHHEIDLARLSDENYKKYKDYIVNYDKQDKSTI